MQKRGNSTNMICKCTYALMQIDAYTPCLYTFTFTFTRTQMDALVTLPDDALATMLTEPMASRIKRKQLVSRIERLEEAMKEHNELQLYIAVVSKRMQEHACLHCMNAQSESNNCYLNFIFRACDRAGRGIIRRGKQKGGSIDRRIKQLIN